MDFNGIQEFWNQYWPTVVTVIGVVGGVGVTAYGIWTTVKTTLQPILDWIKSKKENA